MKELAKEFEAKSECLGEKQNHYTKPFPIQKEVTKIDKGVVTISYKIKFLDSARIMVTLLSKLVDTLIQGIHKTICKDCDCFLEYESVKENSIKCKFRSCNKDYSNKIDEELKKRFKDTFKFSNNDINKSILLLKKGVYPYEYMNERKNLN